MENFDPVGGGYLVQRISDFFSGGGGGNEGLIQFASGALSFFKVIFITFLILFIGGIVYVVYQLGKFRPNYKFVSGPEDVPQQKIAKRRWEDIMQRFNLGTESDWRLSVIEADSLVDDVFKRIGFEGETLGERITAISTEEIQSIGELKEAHQVRNRLVHTAGYKISRQEAERALRRYEKILEELEVI